MRIVTLKAGVYRILNLINGKCYIGSSKNIHSRLREHERNLERGIHCNKYLQLSYIKYNGAFLLYIIEFCEETDIRVLEQKYMDFYNSYHRNYGYNIDTKAENASTKMSDETRAILSRKAKSRPGNSERAIIMQQSNIGRDRPNHAELMRERWVETSKYFGWHKLSVEKQNTVRKTISEKTSKRFEDDKNVRGNTQITAIIGTQKIIFRSFHTAAKYFNVDRGGIRYAIDNCSGFMKKINVTFQ